MSLSNSTILVTTPKRSRTWRLGRSLPEFWYLFGAALISTLWLNAPYWVRIVELMHVKSAIDVVFLLSQMGLVLGGTTALFLLLCWSKAIKPMLTVLFILSAACAYFSFQYQVYFDRHMMTNVMRTDVAEAKDLLSWKLLVWLLVFLTPALTYVWYVRIRPIAKRLKALLVHVGFAVVGIALGLCISLPIYKNYASFYRNHKEVVKTLVPFNYINANISYAQHQYKEAHRVFVHVGMDAKQEKPVSVTKPTVFVVVVGETARADRFALNGYGKPTNPLLSQETGLASFTQASSCGTYTAYSVPCMFSDLPRKDFNVDQAPQRENLLDIVKRAGADVMWYDNQSGCQGTCERVSSERLKQDCPESLCYDEQLVTALQQKLQQPVSKDQLIVLHMNGSHGPAYYQRYGKEFEVFKPSCDTNAIETCSQQQLNNVFDNTIVHTDAVLDGIIQTLKKQQDVNTVMLYMSDHGESLGENGLYLHGTPYAIAPKEQTHIPFVLWANPQFYQQQGLQDACLIQMAKQTPVSQDNLFHTVLGGLNIRTQVYDAKLDVFKQCQKGAA